MMVKGQFWKALAAWLKVVTCTIDESPLNPEPVAPDTMILPAFDDTDAKRSLTSNPKSTSTCPALGRLKEIPHPFTVA
jgi:hypothetical protein